MANPIHIIQSYFDFLISSVMQSIWCYTFLVRTLRNLSGPKYVAIILDGNRRFARKVGMDTKISHRYVVSLFQNAISTKVTAFSNVTRRAFDEITPTELTLYAFSKDNYRRTPEEIEALMALCNEEILNVLNYRKKSKDNMEKATRYRVIGEIETFPMECRSNLGKLMCQDYHKASDGLVVNLALGYTSHDELTVTIREILKAVVENRLQLDDIDEDLIDNSLFTNMQNTPQILIRPSGVRRFSDFLTWQCSNSLLLFVDHCLPEVTVWDTVMCFLHYQYQQTYLTAVEQQCAFIKFQDKYMDFDSERIDRIENFVETLKQKRFVQLKSFILEDS